MTQFDQAENEDINTTRSFRPCPDSEGLGDWGCVSEVNGPDSDEVLNFAPTRDELIQLVKHWATIAFSNQFDFFVYPEQVSFKPAALAGHRIGRIRTVLGEEAVEKAINEAEEEFSKTVSPRAWSIFKIGAKEEVQAFRDEVEEDLRSWTGDEAAAKAINEAEEEFSKSSPRAWSVFKNGTEEAWQAFRDEVDEALRSWNPEGEKQKGADDR
jgi:hypothetical protein